MKEAGCKPNHIVYSNVMHALTQQDRIEESLSVLENMIKDGFQPGVVTYNILFANVAKMGEAALELVKRMHKNGLIPNIDSYNFVIDAMCRHYAMDIVSEVVKWMRERDIKFNQQTYNTLISGYANFGNIKISSEFVNQMIKDGFKFEKNVIGALIKGMLKTGQIEDLHYLLKIMGEKKEFIEPLTIVKIVDYALEKGDAKNLFEVITLLDQKIGISYKISVKSYETLFTKLAEFRKDGIRICEKIILEMEKHKIKPTEVIYNAMLDGYIGGDSPEKAAEIYKFMLQNKMKPKRKSIETLKQWLIEHNQKDLVNTLF